MWRKHLSETMKKKWKVPEVAEPDRPAPAKTKVHLGLSMWLAR